MVKTLMSTMTIAMVAADDVTSLLQLSAGVRQSQGQRILAAVADEGKDTICVEAAAGDVAPVIGSFTARVSQQTAMVAAGSVAGEAGSFCVAKQDVLLMQRTFGLNTARDFEAALGSKKAAVATTTTTTTVDFDNFDFAGDLNKTVVVKVDACPKVEAGLVQTMDASVQQKSAKKELNADQLRVCACRNFLKSNVEQAFSVPEIKELFKGMQNQAEIRARSSGTGLLQRNFDTVLAAKKPKDTTTTTTTEPVAAAAIVAACTGASSMGNWTSVAQLLNNPDVTSLAHAANITGGWSHCDQSWVVQGACGVFDTGICTAECKGIDTGICDLNSTDTAYCNISCKKHEGLAKASCIQKLCTDPFVKPCQQKLVTECNTKCVNKIATAR